MMDTNSRLMRLAAIARADKRGLKQALKIICPDWIPGGGSPGVPNLEYTRTYAPGWRAVSVTVGKILADYDVSPADIEGLAILFEATEPKEDSTPVTAQRLADFVPCNDRVIRKALEELIPIVCAAGRNGGHQWPYSEAVAILKRVTTGKLAGVTWPDSEAELTSKKDSSKIPANKLRR